MMLTGAFILLLVLFVLPFAPGVREFRKQRDAAPLFINMEYHKYPRYFATSFRKKMVDSLTDSNATEGHRELNLSKREQVQIIDQAVFRQEESLGHLLYVLRDLESGVNVSFGKEVYVRGAARIGTINRLHALACDGDIRIGRGTRVVRWIDAEGDVVAGESCSLGIDATCGGMLSAGRSCTFLRLFGNPVCAGEAGTRDDVWQEFEDAPALLTPDEAINRNPPDIPPLSLTQSSIVSDASLTVADYAVVRGHIKSHADLILGAQVTVTGNIFADGDVVLGPGCRVLGAVFSQQHITLKESAQVGSRNRIKSVIGKKGVTLEQGARVFGFVMTEGRGLIA
jgi:acyl-[acyl carrier protein]--UDP-N-acetylglucosamine O-acyltransferase